MGNTKFNISSEAKDIIDELKILLDEDERSPIIQLALAKGIANISDNLIEPIKYNSSGTWTVPENLIKDPEYVLFKHLIINEYKKPISDQDMNKYFAFLIESGLRLILKSIESKTDFDDLRIQILR